MPRLNPNRASKRAAVLATIPPNPCSGFQMSRPQVAALMGVSTQTVKRMRLPWHKVGVQDRLSYGEYCELTKSGIRTHLYPSELKEAAE